MPEDLPWGDAGHNIDYVVEFPADCNFVSLIRYHSTVCSRPFSKSTFALYPKCFSAREMSAKECLTSPARSGPYFTSPEYPVRVFRIWKVSYRSTRRPVATLKTFPATSGSLLLH